MTHARSLRWMDGEGAWLDLRALHACPEGLGPIGATSARNILLNCPGVAPRQFGSARQGRFWAMREHGLSSHGMSVEPAFRQPEARKVAASPDDVVWVPGGEMLQGMRVHSARPPVVNPVLPLTLVSAVALALFR